MSSISRNLTGEYQTSIKMLRSGSWVMNPLTADELAGDITVDGNGHSGRGELEVNESSIRRQVGKLESDDGESGWRQTEMW